MQKVFILLLVLGLVFMAGCGTDDSASDIQDQEEATQAVEELTEDLSDLSENLDKVTEGLE